ncbi:hypothetical protein FIBSPDRAFT_855861 [Athelia psychrophila]|uniref:Uncharacterized protein n=1 Tax=Athelia psychrophila TaxID=1759441 RepID=A0A166NSN5_9AGAM|nr:hypothetical protein FIBSPDRAFT_855861 [Fibularhizoctonia sp. CBS 109695]
MILERDHVNYQSKPVEFGSIPTGVQGCFSAPFIALIPPETIPEPLVSAKTDPSDIDLDLDLHSLLCL